MTNKILERHYYAFDVETLSPLNSSSGENINSDSDVFRNGNNEITVTGTSLTGSFRSYLDELPDKEFSKFGYAIPRDDESISKMSSFFISDLFLVNSKVSNRDNVSLNEDNSVNNKFDTEIIETGAIGTIYINFIKREQDEDDYISIVNAIINGINNGNIRIGKKKNRGYGLLRVLNVYHVGFDKNNVDEYVKFKSNQKNLEYYKKVDLSTNATVDKYCKIKINFNIPGGLIIREYSTEMGEADYSHIKCGNKSVIPGTSFAGVIRKRAKRILSEIKYVNADQLINEWFGYFDLSNNESQQSSIVVAESVINGGKDLLRIRNSIDHFTGGTVEGALYNENVHFEGNVSLTILIRKKANYKAIIGLLYLVLSDISNGYVPIGGESNIGYGILESDNSIECNENIEECQKELFNLLNKEAA